MQILSHQRHNRSTIAKRLRQLSFAVIAFGGCSAFSPTEPELPAGAVPLAAQPAFAAWFERTEACSGLGGQFKEIQWFVVPNAETFQTSAGPKVGMWEKAGNVARIIIAGKYIGPLVPLGPLGNDMVLLLSHGVQDREGQVNHDWQEILILHLGLIIQQHRK